MEEIEMFLDEAKEQMDKSVTHCGQELIKIRAGKAMPNMLDSLMVDYYGSPTPITQVASINTPDARTLAVKPWEKNMISEIERAIMNSDLGLNPQNDGEQIRINIPALTEDRRRDLVKQAKNEAENGKISLRNVRKDTNESLKKLLKDGASEDEIKTAEAEVQKITDAHVAKIDELFVLKEKDIMTI
ncbi:MULTISPECIES: ribosome recycling factor [Reichenbachiella]|uniref:ribosome recycling factor n=1 Tax=Reichenbachiella TaxID=156993 RepID=UPI000E6D32D9|nr:MULTISPECIES: ribosome recycling factor [Reichenbachiella]MBU2915100.1 ribosome recycling factor [Reichenbachiella agariperforans]RJE70526.1 ribosome recycling factor [Reichenbachiella sp. MSK19-1]